MSAPASPDWLVDVPFAHRGLYDEAAGVPENTLGAFLAAVDAGYGIELDVRRSLDDALVIAHDDQLERSTGTRASIARSPLEALAELRLDGTEHGLPQLHEALAAIDGRVPVMVEIKSRLQGVGRTERAVLDLLRDYDGPVCVASFDPRTVAWFHERAPQLPRGQTVGSFAHVPVPALLRRWMAGLPRLGTEEPHFLSHGLRSLPSPVSREWRRTGRPLLTWTASTQAELARARELADNVVFEHIRP